MKNRIKPLEGVRNFRDFGGYPGTGGRMIRTGKLFRSAQFGEATDADCAALNTHSITVQADLRRPDERERHGHRWPINGVRVLSSDKGRSKEAPHVQFMKEVSVDADKAQSWMVDYYREAPYRPALVETYRAWFAALCDLNDDEAALVNCAAGKDRTGILCALTHHALGVEQELIFEDYLLTNEAAEVDKHLPILARRFNQHIGKNYPDEVYHAFVGVRSVFLETALASIIAQSGTIDAYMATRLGLGEAERNSLQERLLD